MNEQELLYTYVNTKRIYTHTTFIQNEIQRVKCMVIMKKNIQKIQKYINFKSFSIEFVFLKKRTIFEIENEISVELRRPCQADGRSKENKKKKKYKHSGN